MILRCIRISDETTGETLLHKAIARGDEFAAHFLIAHGADVAATTAAGSSALHYAAQYGLVPIATELLGRGANINLQDDKGNTPSHVAIKNCHAAIIQLFLDDSNVDIDKRNGQVKTLATITRWRKGGGGGYASKCSRRDLVFASRVSAHRLLPSAHRLLPCHPYPGTHRPLACTRP